MTQEEKELLLKDICARLPYGLVLDIDTTDWKAPQGHIQLKIEGTGILSKDMSLIVNGCYYGDNYKPYLRPMSSMTEKEKREYYETMDKYTHRLYPNSADFSEHTEYSWTAETFDWLNKYHFDYRGLIPKDLAIAVTKENNPYEN